MNVDSEIDAFEDLSSTQKAALIARVVHELTVEARKTYGADGRQVADPPRLRAMNEIQRRISDFLVKILEDDTTRPPDESFMRWLLCHPNDPFLEKLLQGAYRRAMEETGPEL